MKRRKLLGICACGGLAGVSGCLGFVVDTAARTRANPAFAMPPVGRWRDRPAGESNGSLRANNHNTTRSNRYQPVSGPTGDVTVEWTISATEFQARNFNRGRSIPEHQSFDAPDADRERTYAYLNDNPVVGETFVVSVPSVDFPGVDEPAGRITPGDVLPTEASFRDSGNGTSPKDVIADMIAFSGISDVTELGPAYDEATPVLYDAITRRAGRGPVGPFVVAWDPDKRSGDSNADSVSKPVVARATATLENGGALPVVLYARRIRHAGDYLFVVGWIVDAGALYTDATTLLVDAGPNRVVQVGESDALQSSVPMSVVESLDSRGQMGSLVFDGPATDDLLSFLPEAFREGDGAAAFADIARRSSGASRNPQTGKEIKIPAQRVARMGDTVEEIQNQLGPCETDLCGTIRKSADGRKELLRDATAQLEGGDDDAARRSLREVRDIVEGDIQRLAAAEYGEEYEAIIDVPGLEAALLRETTLALDPLDDDSDDDGIPDSTDSDSGAVEKLELAVEKGERGISGDDDGDGVWDPIDVSAVDGAVSTERLRINGDVIATGHTFALKEGKKGMNAVNVQVLERIDDSGGDFTWIQVDGPLQWSVVGSSGGDHRVVLTVLAHPESGRAMNKAELIERIASRAEVSQPHAGRAVDAFVDVTVRLHAGIEKNQVKRGMVVAKPGLVDGRNPQTGKEIKIPAFDDDGDGYTESAVLDATLINLDASLVHLASACRGCEYADSWITKPSVMDSKPSRKESIRVLHVDDEPGFAEMSAEHLERENEHLSITTAANAAEGLEYLREARVDCVVSDIIMPSMDGIEFLKTVREDHPDLPFILFTVLNAEEIGSEARSAGATDHLEKTTGIDQYAVLADRIERNVTLSRADSSSSPRTVS